MGNLCSRSSNKPDNFSTPGRVIGSSSSHPAPPPQNQTPRAQIPKTATTQGQGQGQGRTLGSASAAGDARSAAARAAEERAQAARNSAKGKLGRELDRQRAQTRTDTLEAVSAEERRRREVGEVEVGRRWD